MLNESNLPCFRSSMCEKFWCYGKQNAPSPYNRWKTTKEIAFINRHLDIPGDLKEYCLILFCFFKLITELPSEKKRKKLTTDRIVMTLAHDWYEKIWVNSVVKLLNS